jgi:shikimate dehydrogenase
VPLDPTAKMLNKDTQLCISLAARPSNIGTRFHNYLYELLELNFVYKAFAPTDLAQAVAGIRGLPIRGAAVSMPYKEAVIPLIDGLADSAKSIDSVNTIVNDGGTLTGYNTDFQAVATLLHDYQVDRADDFVVLGSGGMAKAVVAALRAAGFRAGTVVARNEATGRPLAEQYGYNWAPTLDPLRPSLLINATPIGMAGDQAAQLAAPHEVIGTAHTVFDVVAFPVETPLVKQARELRKVVITGAEVIALQAAAQFELYTGVRPTPEQVREASEFSRAT